MCWIISDGSAGRCVSASMDVAVRREIGGIVADFGESVTCPMGQVTPCRVWEILSTFESGSFWDAAAGSVVSSGGSAILQDKGWCRVPFIDPDSPGGGVLRQHGNVPGPSHGLGLAWI